jgi:hypothetical protein
MRIPLRARPSFEDVGRFLFRRFRPSVILEAEPDETGSVIVSLPVSILADIAAQNPNFVMEIRAPSPVCFTGLQKTETSHSCLWALMLFAAAMIPKRPWR